MEQIGGISEFKIKSNDTIEVHFPKYAWLQNKISYYAVPRRRNEYPELLLAPVYPQDWNRVWEIMFDVKIDRPGIIYDLTDLLAENGINILKQEGLTPSEELQYSFWVLVKLTTYTETNHLNAKSQKEISEFLQADLNDKLNINGIQEIRVSGVNEIELLYENHYSNVTHSLNSIPKNQLTPFFNANQVFFEIKDYRSVIPTKSLFDALGYNPNGQKRIHGTIFTDFSQKNFFILRLFEPHQKIIFFDIRHQHTVGAIRKLSQVIRSVPEHKYNILYNRVTIKKDPGVESGNIEDASHWYVLMELLDHSDRINTVLETLESQHGLAFGVGKTIKIIDYTDNLKPILSKRYRRKYYAKPSGVNVLRLSLFTFSSLVLLAAICLFFSNFKVIEKNVLSTGFVTALAFAITGIIAVKEFKDSIQYLFRGILPNSWTED